MVWLYVNVCKKSIDYKLESKMERVSIAAFGGENAP